MDLSRASEPEIHRSATRKRGPRYWVILVLAAVALYAGPRTAMAQGAPTLTTEPTSGPAGSLITLIGSGFTPGGYEGIVFWDGKASDTLTIPAGGDFRSTFRVPVDAVEDEHTLDVCAAERNQAGELVCFSGEFAQDAGTLFVVDAPAQDPPSLSSDPRSGPAGARITLIGANFTPGNYDGLIFWNGNPVDRLEIPAGGAFRSSFRVPVDATVGEHIVRVCAAEADTAGDLSCFTGEFAQEAETLFVVDAAPPIRVCKAEVDPCSPFSQATLYRTTDDLAFNVDEDGYVLQPGSLAPDDPVWASALNSTLPGYEVYFTSGEPVAVRDLYFDPNAGEYRLSLSLDTPLLLHNLTISAAWHVEGNDAYKQLLRDNLDKAARYFYDFTDGQMSLGTITVYQSLDNWESADVRLYASNTLRPNAVIGGVVDAATPDPNATLNITYTPGTVDMGSAWNRYGVPPGQVVQVGGIDVNTSILTDDWSVAFVHELGHFLLYLFDTYRDANGQDNAAIAAQCTGSAMGDVYQPFNFAFVADPAQWQNNCGATEAYAMHQGRTEWETIVGWYPWLRVPTDPARVNGLPVDVTSVVFEPPTTTPGQALLTENVTLNYVDGETASAEARAFIYRNDRIIEQGKPIAGSNQLALTGPEAGDLLCVYDVNDFSEGAGAGPRHQFGCEALNPGDATLEMSKDGTWRPVVTLQQIADDTLRISVTQELPAAFIAALTVQIYPEHQQGLPPTPLVNISGADFADDVVLPGPVPPLYVRLYVDEAVAGATTRRETVLDRGTGGSGLFGPARKFGGVLIYSSDGRASYRRAGDLTLAAGESMAWQSMAGTPPLPADKRITGQAYRLDTFPAALVTEGTVQIEFEAGANAASADAAHAGVAASTPAIHFFDGQDWQPLNTSIGAPTSGTANTMLASAPSQGTGVYAVLYDVAPEPDLKRVWLPLLRVR